MTAPAISFTLTSAGNSGTTQSITIPAAPTGGDVVTIFGVNQSAQLFSAISSGWNSAVSVAGYRVIWKARAGGTAGETVVFTTTSGIVRLLVAVGRTGLDGTTALVKTYSGGAGTSTFHPATAGTWSGGTGTIAPQSLIMVTSLGSIATGSNGTTILTDLTAAVTTAQAVTTPAFTLCMVQEETYTPTTATANTSTGLNWSSNGCFMLHLGFSPSTGLTANDYGEISIVGGTGSVSGLSLAAAMPDWRGRPTQWRKYRASASGTLAVDTSGSGWSVDVGIWTDPTTTPVTVGTGTASFAVTAGSSYWLSFQSTSSATPTGTSTISAAFTGPNSGDPPPPIVATAAATVTTTAAVEPSSPAGPGGPGGPSLPGIPSGTLPPPSEVVEHPILVTSTGAAWGLPRIVVDGVDVTFYGTPPVPSSLTYERRLPFGPGPGTLTIPGIRRGATLPSWARSGALVQEVKMVGSTPTVLWSGVLAPHTIDLDPEKFRRGLGAIGVAFLGAMQIHKPPQWMDETDRGTLIADAMNRVVGRRIANVARVATGITTSNQGTWNQTTVDRVQELLGDMTTDDGSDQWTLAEPRSTPRSLVLCLKNTIPGASTWTFPHSSIGLRAPLTSDPTEAPNAIYGYGISPDGQSWANWFWPGAQATTVPSYPFASSSRVFTIGTRDSDTDTGTGVSDWQTRVSALGYPVAVDGVYNAADAAVARRVQRALGLTIDGVVGPQTWDATWQSVGSLGDPLRLPLAVDTRVEPFLYGPDGSIRGPNTAYEPERLRVETNLAMGSNITKAEASLSAARQVTRNATAGWVGSASLTGDPVEGSRFDIREGDKLVLPDVDGASATTFLIAGARYDLHSSPRTVSVDLDTRNRDLLTIQQILSRDAESKMDPDRIPGRRGSLARQARDAVTATEADSPAGRVPTVSIFAGLWTILLVPFGQGGDVAQVTAKTFSPVTQFCLAFFGGGDAGYPTPAGLIAIDSALATPLTDPGDSWQPFDRHKQTLIDRYGYLQNIGNPGQAAGYGHGYQTSPSPTGGSTPLTGELTASGPWTNRSIKGLMAVAMWAPVATHISVRVWPAPLAN